MKCPQCGSEYYTKKGLLKSGSQRYQCNKCGRWFSESSKKPIPKKPCPYCNSKNVVADGKLESGAQRFRCRTCGKDFSNKTILEHTKPVEYNCPYCGGKLNRSGKGKLGQNEYKCTTCGKSCSGDPPKKLELYRDTHHIKCPYCTSSHINAQGSYSNGHKKFTCKSCGKSFDGEKDYSNEFSRQKRLKQAIDEVLRGAVVLHTANKYNIPEKTLSRNLKSYYVEEFANHKKTSLVLQYAVGFGIPFEELVKYIPCSRKLYKAIVSKYKLPKPVRVELTAEQRQRDKYELERFIKD